MISNFQQCVFAGTGNIPSKMCKIKKETIALPFFGTEHFKKCLILVYPFQEKKWVLHVMRIKLRKTCFTH